MTTLENKVYYELTHGLDKNGYSWAESMDIARYRLDLMDNCEFLELISRHIEEKLLHKEDAK